MKTYLKLIAGFLLVTLVFGCASFERYRLADENKHLIHSVAVLPLIVGDEQGRVSTVGGREFQEFVEYFDNRFFEEFEATVSLSNDVELLLPGRDFTITVFNGMDYAAVARDLGVDAVLAIQLVLYNEIKPGAKGAQVAAAVVTTILLGGHVTERAVVGYDTHFSYLDIGQMDEYLELEYVGKAFPTIEEQRAQFVDRLISYLDIRFPLSSDYQQPYKE